MSFRAVEHAGIREPRTAGVRIVSAYFIEVDTDDYELTTNSREATHGLVDTGDGDWEIVPLSELDGTVTLVRTGDDRYLGF